MQQDDFTPEGDFHMLKIYRISVKKINQWNTFVNIWVLMTNNVSDDDDHKKLSEEVYLTKVK